MYFGADYHPEHWVYPYDGTEEKPEARWEKDIELMLNAGINTVRMGEFSWGHCEREEGKYNFAWLQRIMDLLHKAGIQVVLATPTAAPPLWLSQTHPEILPLDENGLPRREGTRRAYCMNSDVYWDYSKKIVRAMAAALGKHPALIAWQIDNGVGRHNTVHAFNPETKRDWHAWLKAKYETVDKLNQLMGNAFWGQLVTSFEQVPMPMSTPAQHNPALLTDWRRFSSDTAIAFVRMQADLLREITPGKPVTTNLRAFAAEFDYFDMAGVLDFVAVDSDAAVRTKSAEIAMSIDLMRSLKKDGVRLPDGEEGFWVIEQKAGAVSWQEVNSLLRPGVVRLFTYQLLSRGANGVMYFYWRTPRIGPEKFYGGVLTQKGDGKNRIYEEVCQIGKEFKVLDEVLKGTKVVAETAILMTHDNLWAQDQPMKPNKHFHQREHMQLYYNALHDKNIPVDFVRPIDDLSKYKILFAPSLHMLAGGEADRLKLYVDGGGILVASCNTGLVDEHHMTPINGFPNELTDLFGLEVLEMDTLPPGEENHLTFKGSFSTSKLHPARLWIDVIEPQTCTVLAQIARDYYGNRPAITINDYGSGKAVYVGTVSEQHFYYDLLNYVRQFTTLFGLLKVPDGVEVTMRGNDEKRIYFMLNHQNQPVRLTFYKPIHDYLTGTRVSGNYDLAPHGVLILDEHY
ncbi:MAG: beta-galactosidase [Verrucomicrobiota bacterium]